MIYHRPTQTHTDKENNFRRKSPCVSVCVERSGWLMKKRTYKLMTSLAMFFAIWFCAASVSLASPLGHEFLDPDEFTVWNDYYLYDVSELPGADGTLYKVHTYILKGSTVGEMSLQNRDFFLHSHIQNLPLKSWNMGNYRDSISLWPPTAREVYGLDGDKGENFFVFTWVSPMTIRGGVGDAPPVPIPGAVWLLGSGLLGLVGLRRKRK